MFVVLFLLLVRERAFILIFFFSTFMLHTNRINEKKNKAYSCKTDDDDDFWTNKHTTKNTSASSCKSMWKQEKNQSIKPYFCIKFICLFVFFPFCLAFFNKVVVVASLYMLIGSHQHKHKATYKRIKTRFLLFACKTSANFFFILLL